MQLGDRGSREPWTTSPPVPLSMNGEGGRIVEILTGQLLIEHSKPSAWHSIGRGMRFMGADRFAVSKNILPHEASKQHSRQA